MVYCPDNSEIKVESGRLKVESGVQEATEVIDLIE